MDNARELGVLDKRYINPDAMTWAQWQAHKHANRRPYGVHNAIAATCWHYCYPGNSGGWLDQCAMIGCHCPCHRSAGAER